MYKKHLVGIELFSQVKNFFYSKAADHVTENDPRYIFFLWHFQNYIAASPIRKKGAAFCEQSSRHVLLVVSKKPLSTQDWQLKNWQLSFKISNNSFILGQHIFIYLLAFFKKIFPFVLGSSFYQQFPPLKLPFWGILCKKKKLWIDYLYKWAFSYYSCQLEFYLVIFLKANSQPVRHFRGVWNVMVVWYLHKEHRIIRSFRCSSTIIVKFMHKLNQIKLG